MKRFKYLTLVALVAVAACDEGVDPIVAPVTGTIAGVVTIEAVAAVGVTVTLSSGPTATTDAAGAYQFDGVPVGSYTVTISGFASDATFTATLKAATISSSGQVVTANFDGSYVRTSAIIGSVSVGGASLPGVSIVIGGMSAAGTATDQNGQYSFSGLRAGSYTVEMTNPNTASYNFGSTSASVTLATGASEVVSFEGSLVTTAQITGSLFIDEFSKDSILNTGLEENLTIAGVPISLEGILVLDTMTVLTDATGSFSFTDLAEGSYHITIGSLANVPGMVAFSGMTQLTTTVGPGGHETANFPFSIITQTINVGAFLGTDLDVASKPGAGITPIKDWSLRLFDTQAHAAAYVATGATAGKLTSKAVKTGSNGMATFRFARAKDLSPDSSKVDNLVFAATRTTGPPSTTYAANGEDIIEIQYATTDSSSTAVDEFDALYNALTVAFNGKEIDGDPLKGWDVLIQANKDTTKAIATTRVLDSKGWGYADLTVANLTPSAGAVLPYTLTLRLLKTQGNANGHGFTQVPTGVEGTTQKGRIKFVWDGTQLPYDTVWIGTETVTYTDVDILVGIHQEKDDSTDVATYTKGDATGSVAGAARLELYKWKSTTSKYVSQGAAAAPSGAGQLTYANLLVDTM
ncbi:MAG: carboxypeptidase regulatory-like domain-containing protein [Acidobacteria bacterium]|nr:carboxypeptidase regulatory-like domain-containing protein [Acidobacteriota bacterium]